MNRSFWPWGVTVLWGLAVTLILASCTSPLPTLLAGPPPFSLTGAIQLMLAPDRVPTVQPAALPTVAVQPALTAPVTLTATVSLTSALAISATPAIDQAALIQHGYAVYLKQYCGVCHQLDAAATTGAFGPSHNGVAHIAAARVEDPAYTGKATTAAAYLRESILEPDAYMVPEYILTAHRMPAFTHLSQDEVNALVAMLLAQE